MVEAAREAPKEGASGPSWVKSVIALLIVSFTALGAYFILYKLTDDKAAASFSSLVFAIYPQIDQSLKYRTLRIRRPTWPKDIVPLESFTIPWYHMLLYGVLIIIGSVDIARLFVDDFLPILSHWLHMPTDWLINWLNIHFGSPQLPPQIKIQISASDAARANRAFVGFVLVPVILYFLGSWIGSRCNRLGAFVVIAVVILAGFIDLALDYILYTDTNFAALHQGEEKSVGLFITLALSKLSVNFWQIFSGLVGFAHGQRKRMSGYFRYLLSHLSSTDREAIIDMAYEAAKEKSFIV